MPFRVFRSLSDVPADFGPSALTIGNFDGVHAGHCVLLHRVVELGRSHSWTPSVLTFDPHPTKVVAPRRAPRLLTTIEQRFEMLRDQGIEQVLALPFTAEVAKLTPDEFASQILAHALKARAVVVGDNFRFGSHQAGDVAKLTALGEVHGFRVETAGEVSLRGRIVSSTEIRKLLGAGNIQLANRLLGHPFALEGDVVAGHGIGRSKTVPTLNLDTASEVLPANGVYITRTSDLDAPDRRWNSISNIGYRPTFEGKELSIETFLLSPFDGNDPKRIRVEFLHRVREERKFDSPDALKAQIFRDAATAQKYFRRTRTIY
ncbi:MAG TPA: bifunctional riboflavin kinase/FAD synthetase [Bryobacteraceae bacterium]|jgi:riboflavin kinase/FMN adenylyltransferase